MEKPITPLWEEPLPYKVQEMGAIDDMHLCAVVGFMLRIYEISEQDIKLVAQVRVAAERWPHA